MTSERGRDGGGEKAAAEMEKKGAHERAIADAGADILQKLDDAFQEGFCISKLQFELPPESATSVVRTAEYADQGSVGTSDERSGTYFYTNDDKEGMRVTKGHEVLYDAAYLKEVHETGIDDGDRAHRMEHPNISPDTVLHVNAEFSDGLVVEAVRASSDSPFVIKVTAGKDSAMPGAVLQTLLRGAGRELEIKNVPTSVQVKLKKTRS